METQPSVQSSSLNIGNQVLPVRRILLSICSGVISEVLATFPAKCEWTVNGPSLAPVTSDCHGKPAPTHNELLIIRDNSHEMRTTGLTVETSYSSSVSILEAKDQGASFNSTETRRWINRIHNFSAYSLGSFTMR